MELTDRQASATLESVFLFQQARGPCQEADCLTDQLPRGDFCGYRVRVGGDEYASSLLTAEQALGHERVLRSPDGAERGVVVLH